MRKKVNGYSTNKKSRFQSKINELHLPKTCFKITIKDFWKARKTFLTFVSCFIFILLCGTDDHEAIELYLDKLQELSEHKIRENQRLLVSDFYCFNKNRDPSQKQRHKIRSEFNSKKHKLKVEWESIYHLSWPKTMTCSKPIVALVPKKSIKGNVTAVPKNNIHNYEAHHIIPINAGGINKWWNLSPLSSENHRLLHNSIEEKACFSHDFVHQKTMRFILRIKRMFWHYFGNYVHKQGTNYAHSLL